MGRPGSNGLFSGQRDVGPTLAQGALRPRWASWTAYARAIFNLVGSVAGFYVSKTGKSNALGFAGFIGLVLFLVTVVAISVDVLGPAETTA